MRTALVAGLLLALPLSLQARTDEPTRPWTLLVYGGADNNADGPILDFLDDVRKAIDDDPGIELLLLLDRSAGFSDDAQLLGQDFAGARLYRLTRDKAERLAGGTQFPELSDPEQDAEIDSADAFNVQRFIEWGKEHYPARHYGLMIYSHADGRGMCPDEESGREMGIPELSQALGKADSLDFLALELCNMGGIEISYQWRPGPGRFGADVLVAIPNAGPPLDWDRAFARIRTPGHATTAAEPVLDPATMTAADFGRLVIDEGWRGREQMAARNPGRGGGEAAGCYDLRRAAEVKRAVDALAVALGEEPDSKEVFCEMRGPGPIGTAIHYDGLDGPYIDLYDLCQRAAACDTLGQRVRARSEDVLTAVDAFVLASFGMSDHRGFQPGKNGVFIVMPIAEEGRWRNFRWYDPRANEQQGKDLGGWAFLADGATPGNGRVENWFELLDRWFDVDDDGGGVNGYRP